MALFQPSLGYKDYRLEFFGQIETKSMDWMVRAHDAQNYYAMKFKVIEPGLRPVIAMVHYPVVGGRPGHSTETPLNVMIHNSMPYRVAVDVHGNRIVTSIEGQEVDTWVDDTLPSGGVGFFAEAGSRSRLYWMKLYKNDDLLGRICAYLAGNGSGTQTAEVWGPGIPAGPNSLRFQRRATTRLRRLQCLSACRSAPEGEQIDGGRNHGVSHQFRDRQDHAAGGDEYR